MPPKKIKRQESDSRMSETATQTAPLEAEPPKPPGFIEPFTDASTPKEKELARYHRTLLTMIGQDRSKPHMFWCIPLILRGERVISMQDDSMAHLERFASALVERSGNFDSVRRIIFRTFKGKRDNDLREMQHEDDVIHLVEVEQFRKESEGMPKWTTMTLHELFRQLSFEILLELTDMSLEQRDELDRMTREESGVFSNAAFIKDVRPYSLRDRFDRVEARERKVAAYQRAKQNADKRK